MINLKDEQWLTITAAKEVPERKLGKRLHIEIRKMLDFGMSNRRSKRSRVIKKKKTILS